MPNYENRPEMGDYGYETEPEDRLAQALYNLQIMFSGDEAVMRQFAREHHTSVEVGDMFTPVKNEGQYQIRLPGDLQEEVARILESESLNILCGDMRAAKETVEVLGCNNGEEAMIIMAGGGGQVDDLRLQSLAQVARVYHEVRPDGVIRAVAHTGYCGGIRLGMGGEQFFGALGGDTRRDGGAERNLVNHLLQAFRDELALGSWYDSAPVNTGNVALFTAHITGPNHGSFEELEIHPIV